MKELKKYLITFSGRPNRKRLISAFANIAEYTDIVNDRTYLFLSGVDEKDLKRKFSFNLVDYVGDGFMLLCVTDEMEGSIFITSDKAKEFFIKANQRIRDAKDEAPDQDRVNSILDKVLKKGKSSLTKREKKVLRNF